MPLMPHVAGAVFETLSLNHAVHGATCWPRGHKCWPYVATKAQLAYRTLKVVFCDLNVHFLTISRAIYVDFPPNFQDCLTKWLWNKSYFDTKTY